ncbi:protein kinase family protein [Frankia nepalensis]|uniref:protein kinase family protein n=1 Tax=Frankia nepalensis TaxID=1836974 RepID=UPI0027DC66D9|nr:protein kinase family protein [Frankia nepalensis]
MTNGASPAGGEILLAESVLDRRYRLIGVLSSRGPVTLWRGDDTVLTRPVAVRAVEHTDDDAGRRQVAQSLLSAAVNSGRLVHPGAASTYDATVTSTENGQVSYVITEWVDGRTLRQLATEGPLRAEQAAAVVLGAARVIAAAHERGLRHGGLRPGDVIVSSHGTVKVIDLEVGAVLARIDGVGPDGEQDAAEAAADDVRALGGLLYAALTGHWPLPGDTGLPSAPYGTYGRLQSPRQLNHAVPRDLDAITMAALSGEDTVGEPIVTAVDLIAELEAVTPVEALHDTGLMTFGDEPANTEEMAPGYGAGGYGPDGYGPDTANLPSTAGFAAPGPDDYDRGRGRYDDYDRGYPDDRYRGRYQDDYDEGYDRDGYDRRYRDDYPPAQRGYPPAGPSGTGPRGGRPAAGGQQPGRRRVPIIIGAIVVVLVLVVGIVLALQLGGGEGDDPGNTPATSAGPTQGLPVTPAGAESFDPPPGDGNEKPGSVSRAYDGDVATQWETEGYNPPFTFGRPEKKGVGLLFDLGDARDVSQVVVTVGSLAPSSFEIRAADTKGTELGQFQVVGQQQGASNEVKVTISPRGAHRYWLVWLTDLPQAEGKFKGSIAEVQFLS